MLVRYMFKPRIVAHKESKLCFYRGFERLLKETEGFKRVYIILDTARRISHYLMLLLEVKNKLYPQQIIDPNDSKYYNLESDSNYHNNLIIEGVKFEFVSLQRWIKEELVTKKAIIYRMWG